MKQPDGSTLWVEGATDISLLGLAYARWQKLRARQPSVGWML
jgi:hypothetical protein